jgi:hypothetical protein
MNNPRLHRTPAHPAAKAQARAAARSTDPDRAVNWTVAAALALFLAVMLLHIGG